MPEVVCTRLSPDMTCLRVESLRVASKATGVSRNAIIRRIINAKPTKGGWLFDWGNDPLNEGDAIEAAFKARELEANIRRRERRRPTWESILRRTTS